MTLIIAGWSANFIFAATDRRCVLVDAKGKGRVRDSNSNKAFGLTCADASLLICWTGLLEFNDVSTDDWLTKVLRNVNVSEMSGQQISELIVAKANAEITPFLSRRAPSLIHTFLIVGWYDNRDGTFSARASDISNYGTSKVRRQGVQQPFGLTDLELHTPILNDNATAFFRGLSNSVTPGDKQKFLFFLQSSPNEDSVAGRIGAMIKKASKSKESLNGISRECRGWIIYPHFFKTFEFPKKDYKHLESVTFDTPFRMGGVQVSEMRYEPMTAEKWSKLMEEMGENKSKPEE